MKIIMVCGSPRPQKSTSQYLLDALKERLDSEHEVIMCHAAMRNGSAEQLILENMKDTKAMVLAFPLYVDGIPGSLLHTMKNIEQQLKEVRSDCKVYVLVNNGFYDARQNAIAIDMVWNWCKRSGLEKGRAVGLGAGEMAQVTPLGVGPSRNLGSLIEQLSKDIRGRNSKETLFVEPNFPKLLYKMAAHRGWRKSIKKNGLKVADIRLKLPH